MTSKTYIPNGWRQVRLGEIADVVMGQSPSSTTVVVLGDQPVSDKGVPFIQGNAEFGGRFPSPMKWCVKPLKMAKPNDVLISVRAPVGETNIADQPLAIGRGLAAIRFNGSGANYGWHILNFAKQAFERVTQGSTFDAIGSNDVRSLSILLPPLSEQRVISAVLDSIDEAIECTSEVIAVKEQLQNSLLHELLTHGVPGWHIEWKEVRGLGTVPLCWDVVRLEDVADVIMGQSPPGRTVSDWDGGDSGGGGLPFIQGNAEFGAKYPSPVKRCCRPLKVARYGDILISVRAPVGEISRVDQTLGIGRGLAAVRFTGVAEAYGWHALNQAKRAFDRLAQGSTFEAIGSNELRSLPILLPPLAEQHVIATTLDSVDTALEWAREESAALQLLQESISEVLLTGRLRIDLGKWSTSDVP